MTIRTLIVDDEPLARRGLELRLRDAADITIVDPEKKVLIDDSFLISRCKNTPFLGAELFGSVEYTICSGRVVYAKER